MTAEQIAKIVDVPTGGFKVTITGLPAEELANITVSTFMTARGTDVEGGILANNG